MKTQEIKEQFLKDFWQWFTKYHEDRYRKEGKILSPDINYHRRFMKFDNYAWDWVALFVKETREQDTDKNDKIWMQRLQEHEGRWKAANTNRILNVINKKIQTYEEDENYESSGYEDYVEILEDIKEDIRKEMLQEVKHDN